MVIKLTIMKNIKIKVQRFIKPSILWQWTDIAICIRIYKQSYFSDYHIGIDIQILWFDLWIQCFRKSTKQNR